MAKLERDLFYHENHRLQDAKLHDAILDDGDHATAQKASDSVAREIGLTDAEIAALHAPLSAKTSTKRLQRYSEDEPRDDQGRWTDGGGSSDGGGSKPVAGYSPGVKTPLGGKIEHAKTVKADFIAKSPVKTIDDVKRLAAEGQKALGDVGRQISAKLGLTFKDPGPKTKTESGVRRVQDKAAERGGNLASVTDTARATFLVDHPAQTDQIISELGKHFEVAAEPFKMTPENYADRSANVRLPNGVIAEVQMMHPKMADAKSPDGGGGHDLYKVSRESAPTGVKPDPAKYADAVQKQRELYGNALDAMPADWKKIIYEAVKAFFGIGGRFGKAR
jgi:hypothetical protein